MCEAGKVACCCCQCALSVLLWIIGAFFLVIVIAGIAFGVYYYQNKDGHPHNLDEAGQEVTNIVQNAISQTKDVLKGLQN